MSQVDVLAELPARHPDRPRLLGVLGRQLAGLVERQHRTGLWRVVLDHPDAYLETSGSAMIGYGLAQAARLVSGSDARRFREAARRAWDGLATYVRRRDGTVALMGAQAPSGGGDWERHKTAAVGEQPYATGPFLMLGASFVNATTPATTPAQEERP
jgi:rhamnogalacturonyl hydrolase YesR